MWTSLRALPTTNYDPIYANVDLYIKQQMVGGHQDDSGYLRQ